MIRGMYSAASALDASGRQQEILAENLAHAATPGFRRHGVTFETLQLNPASGTSPAAGMQATRSYTSFEAGPMQRTGNPLDLALNGDVFFVLESPRGPVYTRSGIFQLNGQGELQSPGGLRVQGQGGPIAIPPGTSRIEIAQDGNVRADGNEIGRLQIAYVADARALRRVGPTLFEGPPPQPPPETVSYRVEQGYREGSNVNAVHEMVAMMTGMRQYEAAQRALKAMAEAAQRNTSPTG